jgi:glucose/arabinose dehydrogenase
MIPKARLSLVAAIGAGLALVGAVAAQPPAQPGSAPQIFNSTCASCHGRDLKGATAKTVFSEAVLAKGDAELMKSIAAGPVGVPDHAFKTSLGLTDDQVFRLAVYMRVQGGNLKPKPAFVENPNGQVISSARQTFKVETVADGLETPWGMAFLPDGRLLVTERPGRLRIVGRGGKLSAPVPGVPRVWERQDSGLLDIALHPDYARNGWIYLAYTDVVPGYVAPPASAAPAAPAAPGAAPPRPVSPPSMTVLIRGKLTAAGEWVTDREIFRAPNELYTPSGSHYGTRFVFDKQGHLFYSLGERGDPNNAQKLTSPLGKIHRVNDDGSVPADNPFVNTPGAIKTIWTYGHRNPEGLAFDPVSGLLWESEHGPTGGDEINVIEKGKNYGWGVISMGIQPGITKTAEPGMEQPVAYYTPTLAPSGIHFYAGAKYPAWKNNLFVGMLAGQQLRRLEVKGRQVVSQEVLFDQFGRTRAVATGPDGLLYALVQNPTGQGTGVSLSASTPGRVVRLAPAQ